MEPVKYVVVDWRPYDLPTVIGPFDTEEEAKSYYMRLHDLVEDGWDFDDLDGIDVRQLEPVLKDV